MNDILGSSRRYYYVLDDRGEPVAVDYRTWADWSDIHDEDRRVALDIVGPAEVSTVFLGLDHNFSGGAPILFETLVFAPNKDGERVGVETSMRRYTTREEAIDGHQETVMFLRGLKDEQSL